MAKSDLLFLEIHHWVIQSAAGWTEQDAENRMDALRTATRDLVRANQANQAQWVALTFAGRTQEIAVRTEAGKVYLHVAYVLQATVTANADAQAVREAIGSLMQGAFANLSQGIYDYQKSVEDFGTESPVSYVASSGDDFGGNGGSFR